MLGLGANAIVAAGHALVADVASNWRNAALNLLDICFGLGLASLPLVVQRLQRVGGPGLIFSSLGGAAVILLVLILASRFPRPTHPESSPITEAPTLFRDRKITLLNTS